MTPSRGLEARAGAEASVAVSVLELPLGVIRLCGVKFLVCQGRPASRMPPAAPRLTQVARVQQQGADPEQPCDQVARDGNR